MITQRTIRVPASLLAIVLTAVAMHVMAAGTAAPQPTGTAPVQAPHVGVFTGKFVNGMPVYRLPPVDVIAYRKVELARMEREEQLARARQVRAKAALRRPA